MNSAGQQRLIQLIGLVDKEGQHLLGVRQRLLGGDCAVDAQRLESLLADDAGIDRLESFGAKFARMLDTVVDKLMPEILRQAGESVGAAIDNLTRLEKLDLIRSADDWMATRVLRNRLVHEYMDRPEDLAPALAGACTFTDIMHADYASLKTFAVTRLGVVLP